VGAVPARLYYDAGCGPCTFFARAATWASHRQLVSIPLDAPTADLDLSRLSESVRFGYAHLADDTGLRSGADIMNPLVRLTVGGVGARVIRAVSPVDRSLRWAYQRFWNYRRMKGCAAEIGTGSG
jgi:hypothetical protein